MKQVSWTLLLTLTAVAAAVSAASSFNSVGDSSVKFEAMGPAGLKINGESGGVRAVASDGKLTISAPTTGFHTGIGLRDRHLREYLESEKHPEATLVVELSSLKLPEAGASTSGVVTGAMTLHGVTKPEKVNYHVTRTGDDYRATGDLELDIEDFQIKKPCYLGVCVGANVKVSAEFAVHGG